MEEVGAIVQRARALTARGDLAAALEVLEEAVRVEPRSAPVWFEIGVVLAKQGEAEEAVDAFDHATDLEPRFAEAHFHKGLLLAELGREDEASRSLSKSADLSDSFRRLVDAELARVGSEPP
jgi:Flp pilus assembly protein TadD